MFLSLRAVGRQRPRAPSYPRHKKASTALPRRIACLLVLQVLVEEPDDPAASVASLALGVTDAHERPGYRVERGKESRHRRVRPGCATEGFQRARVMVDERVPRAWVLLDVMVDAAA